MSQKGFDARGWKSPDLLLNGDPEVWQSDVLILETDGFSDSEWSLVELVRERWPMIELIAISSESLVESVIQALRSGVYAVVTYPVSDDYLIEVIEAAFERKRRGEQRIKALDGRNRSWE